MSLLFALSIQAGDNGQFFKKLSGQNIPVDNIVEKFAEWFSLPDATEWREVSRTTDMTGMDRIEYRQFVAGVEVEHSQVLIHAKDGMVLSANGTVMETKRSPAKIHQHSPIYKSGTPTDMLGKQIYLVNTPDGYHYAYKVLSADKHEWVYYDTDTQQVIKRVATWHRSEPYSEKPVKVKAKTIYSGEVMLDAYQNMDGSIYLYDKGRNIHTLNAAYLATYEELFNQDKLFYYFPQGNLPDNYNEATEKQKNEWINYVVELGDNNQLEHIEDYILDYTSYIQDNNKTFKAYKINDISVSDITIKDEDGNLVPFTPNDNDDDFDFDDNDDEDFADGNNTFGEDDDDDYFDDDDDDDDDGNNLYITVYYGADTNNPSKALLTQALVELNDIVEYPEIIPLGNLYQNLPSEGATLIAAIEGETPYSGYDTLAVIPIIPDESGKFEFNNDRIRLVLEYEPAGNPAADIHWGMGKTLDFYKEVFGRDSYDGKGSPVYNLIYNLPETANSFLAFSSNNAAAMSSQAPYPMLYGLGGISIADAMKPVVELSVMAHEFTHIVTGNTANLEYAGEPGALNESFSDIMGISVKKYVTNAADWYIGYEVILDDELQPRSNLRDMADPKNNMDGEDPGPDTYEGQNWADPTDIDDGDDGGVHTNCGVQNKWFFLITEGGEGINDNDDFYNVEGIGLEKAQQIAYLTLTSYATSQSDFTAIRHASLEAAEMLYGVNSKEQKTVAKAWDAVGVSSSPDAFVDAISEMAVDNTPTGATYDLQGRILTGKPTQRGVYIVNGKKIVIK